MNVVGLTVDRGGCAYYRIALPFSAMRAYGHHTMWGSTIDEHSFKKADVIVNQYLHEESTIAQWEKWRDKGKKLLVWECDDDITTVQSVTSSGSAYDNPETLPRMIRGIRASHIVTVTTPRLAEVLRPYNDNIVVLPNRIPGKLLYEPVRRPEKYTITYTASPSHQEDVQEFFPALYRHMQRNPDTVIRLYGPDVRPIGVPSHWQIELMGWQKLPYEYLRNLNGHVGIAPLKRRSEFNKAKSGVKALEYMARGILPICQDYPQYTMLGVHTCRTEAQWVDALNMARENYRRGIPTLEAWMHETAFEHIIERHVRSWIDTYERGLALL